MRKKSLITLVVTILFILALPLFYVGNALFSTPVYNHTFMSAIQDKYDRLKNTEGKRIVIVGGSSTAFGIQSELIKQELPQYEVVNFGVYAALGTKVMLDLSRTLIHQDDLVIIMPEQNAQTLSMYFNSELMWEAIDGRNDILTKISSENYKAMLGGLLNFSNEKLKYHFNNETLNPSGVYNRDSFNEYGDIDYQDREYNIMPSLYDTTTPISFDDSIIDADFIEYMNKYAKDVKKKNAQVYYHFSPMNQEAILDEDKVDDYTTYLFNQLDFDILGSPYISIKDEEWFYDTNFHLNYAGSVNFTIDLIKEIKAELKDTSSTDIDYLNSPETNPNTYYQGDDSDVDLFDFELINHKYQLTKIKENAAKESIIVPTYKDGIPITSIKSNAFEGSSVKEITIQRNIASIGDYAFKNTPNLKTIILENKNPSSVVVSYHLLDDTNAFIKVPKASINDYKVNYFWSNYTSRLVY